MLSVSDASALIQTHKLALPNERVFIEEALGRVLRQSLTADRDVPPFDRVTMDGVAFRFAAFAGGQRQFRVAGVQTAGQPTGPLTDPSACMEVMTGAVLPEGADTVVRYEDLTIENGLATVNIEEVTEWLNVHRQGTDKTQGVVLLDVGTWLRAVDVAVAASVGASTVQVAALPRVAIIATGDELVNVDQTPAPHQIRHSNTYAIQSALRSVGVQASINHLPDEPEQLKQGIANLLATNDMIITSGGVSAGKADFVPDTLVSLGVHCHFHKIEQRPGKPLWFGTTEGDKKVAFGLPGNPVSTTMCVYQYVIPFLRASMGQPEPATQYAQLAQPVTFKPKLTYFLPVRLEHRPDGLRVAHPLPGSGSGDFTNLIDANAFVVLPADRTEFAAGESHRIILI
ncbi:MAG: molybdopterin molybdenumtransferase MoeA [Cytophagales bacterium]|nr:MAG: molybdopterin molybdenumtransferase MoeA [Cytophagales bacterium]